MTSGGGAQKRRARLVNDDAEWARPFRELVAGAPRPLRVLSPCVGLSAPERAGLELKVQWCSLGDWDLNRDLWGALSALAADPSKLHVGYASGDITRVSLGDLPLDTDAIVSGPPCPPFSSIGRRLCELDNRSAVFVTVTKWIQHLAKHGSLTWFILENVQGIMSKRSRDGLSFGEWVLGELRRCLPPDWNIRVVSHNSAACLLPQSRPRVFFCGVGPNLLVSRRQQRLVKAPPMSWPRVQLVDFLETKEEPGDWDILSVRQQLNVLTQLESFRESLEKKGLADTQCAAIVDVARDPLRRFDCSMTANGCGTLRTNCARLWIIPRPASQRVFGARGRLVSRAEKCYLTGILPSSVETLSNSALDTALGNTIPVALIGVVMAPIIASWVEMLRRRARG